MTVLVAAILVVADQATKLWAHAALDPSGPGVALIPGALTPGTLVGGRTMAGCVDSADR